jgi:glycosyltransferase involved in cell wall biosynthesis
MGPARPADLQGATPDSDCELTILMPCLDEAETIERCVEKALRFLRSADISGEVLVADNMSTDGSALLARRAGARVVTIADKGYGNALRGGIAAARGRYVIMGDGDDSYDFEALDGFLAELRRGNELVMGNRFRGGIASGSMPALHRYLGNPLLSAIGRRFFAIGIGDFHCGLRGFDRRAVMALDLRTTGMEFASEMVVKASLADLRIVEVPTTLRPDGRSRPPHLRSWRDGWRHLRFLLVYSPNWLFLYPGLIVMLIGAVGTTVLMTGTLEVGPLQLDLASMIYAAGLTIIGYQAVLFSLATHVYAAQAGLLRLGPRLRAFSDRVSVEQGLLVGLVIFLGGLLVALLQVLRWSDEQFGRMDPSESVRAAVSAMLGLVLGFQTLMYAMFIGILTVPTKGPAAPPPPRVIPLDGRDAER